MKNICIIPARGGSKRIFQKNIREFYGKPLIVRVIETIHYAKIFDQIIVSTDSKEIKRVCSDVNVLISYPRPETLSDDFTPVRDVIDYEIKNLGIEDNDIVCCVLPTAVLLSIDDIKAGYDRFVKSEIISYCFGATRFSYPPQRAFTINSDHYTNMLNENNFFERSQDLLDIWHDTGTFYFAKCSEWKNEPFVFNKRSKVVELDPRYCQDIDDEYDWGIAELKYEAINKFANKSKNI